MDRGIFVSLCFLCFLVLSFNVAPVAFADVEEPIETNKLLPNGSFEAVARGNPVAWKTNTWNGKGTFEHAAIGHTGERSVKISSEKGGDLSWLLVIPVRPFTTYRISGWIKTENVETAGGRGALLNLHNFQTVKTKAITGTQDWTQVEMVVHTEGNDQLHINCLFGGWGLATGTAWYDDLRIEAISTTEWEPNISIDTTKTGPPISKYIYGQFIEHLGRCIYGGIWAEMLEDRKFFHAPGQKPSPWVPVDDDSVTMDKHDPFVGEQTPIIAAGKGMRQAGLGVVRGKRYNGYLWLKADKPNASVRVAMDWKPDDPDNALQRVTIHQVANEYTKYPISFVAETTTDEAVLSIQSKNGACHLGTISLMPTDNIEGMRADTLELLKQLNSPIYRWPGGNFVSGYDWRDGIGDRDRRPPRKNPAWKGIEHNDFGLDEFMTFCRLLDTEPYIAVNSGLGDVENAIAELEYTNGDADTPMGKLREKNGRAEPYAVKWWSIGNEMYGGWQLGHMPLEKYIEKHNQFVEAFRAKDPTVQLVAVGSVGKWSEGMMQHSSDHMDLISEHFYRQGSPGLAAHVQQIPDAVKHIADAHRRYRNQFDSLKGKDIRIALDEWNYWYGPHVYGELGTRYFVKDALGVAAGLNEFARNSDLFFMANYAQTVNVIGSIKTSKTAASFATTGLALKLYRQHFGTIPVDVTTKRPLDVAAAMSEDGKTLTVAVVNPMQRPLELPLEVKGVELVGKGTRWQISGVDPLAYNEPSNPLRVNIVESPLTEISNRLSIAPCSISLFALPVNY